MTKELSNLPDNQTTTTYTDRALVLLSGGQDSTVALFHALQQYKEVFVLTINYGQRHSLEIAAAQNVFNFAKRIYPLKMINKPIFLYVPHILLSSSPLTDLDVEVEKYQSYEQMTNLIKDRQEHTFVPMRNALFLTLAANRAVYHEIGNIVLGICKDDSLNYDDCTADFVTAAHTYINAALGTHRLNKQVLNLETPLITYTKSQIVQYSLELPGAYHAMTLTHTCYANQSPPCGLCHSCILRAEGFNQAGFPDPLMYEH